jgi:hypothetical protein
VNGAARSGRTSFRKHCQAIFLWKGPCIDRNRPPGPHNRPSTESSNRAPGALKIQYGGLKIDLYRDPRIPLPGASKSTPRPGPQIARPGPSRYKPGLKIDDLGMMRPRVYPDLPETSSWVPEGSLAGFWGGAFLKSGRPRGPGNVSKNVGGFAQHIFEGFPGPRGRPDRKMHPQKSGQSVFRYPVK